MARFVRNYNISMCPDIYFNEVSKYLTAEGYVYTVFENENVFQKGFSFIKISFCNNMAVLEAWHKPEIEKTEFESINYRLQYIEQIIMFFERENQNHNQVNMQNRQTISRYEFFKNNGDKKDKNYINILCIVIYVVIGVSVVNDIVIQGKFLAILDYLLILGLTLGIHLAYSRGCAIALTVYGCINVVSLFIITKSVVGYWWLVAGICALVKLNKMYKDYKNFKNEINCASKVNQIN